MSILRIVHEQTGGAPRELRFLETDDGLVAFLTLGLDPQHRARGGARDAPARSRSGSGRERPEIADVHRPHRALSTGEPMAPPRAPSFKGATRVIAAADAGRAGIGGECRSWLDPRRSDQSRI